MRVLVVEDDPINLRLMQWLFKKNLLAQDCELAWASDGVELIQQALEFQPDVIVTDIRMPRMDGLTALERLYQQLGSEHRRPEVIVVTAIEDDRLRLNREELNIVAVLPKPMEVSALVKVLRQLRRSPENLQ